MAGPSGRPSEGWVLLVSFGSPCDKWCWAAPLTAPLPGTPVFSSVQIKDLQVSSMLKQKHLWCEVVAAERF